MAGPILLVLFGSLLITQTLFGQAFERLNVQAAITPGGSTPGNKPSSDTSGPAAAVPAVNPATLPPGTAAA